MAALTCFGGNGGAKDGRTCKQDLQHGLHGIYAVPSRRCFRFGRSRSTVWRRFTNCSCRERTGTGTTDSARGSTGTRTLRGQRSIPRGGVSRKEPLSHGTARTGGTWAGKYGKKIIAWDVAPGEEYFKELFRVSRNQIIWGGNYFDLPPTRCFLVWRKLNIPLEGFSMAAVEYAWTSFFQNARLFEEYSNGNANNVRFHPTQKPVSLYAWIYKNFATPGTKILDTHMGSGSSRIAAWDAGLEFVGCEIDKTYFDLQEERFKKHTGQGRLFPAAVATKPEQLTLL